MWDGETVKQPTSVILQSSETVQRRAHVSAVNTATDTAADNDTETDPATDAATENCMTSTTNKNK